MTCVVHGRTHLGVCTGAGGGRSGIGGKGGGGGGNE